MNGMMSAALITTRRCGRTADALNTAEDSVAIYRRLADATPARYEPDLARALNTLAIRLAEAGMDAEATAS